jgi:hypothetical protein
VEIFKKISSAFSWEAIWSGHAERVKPMNERERRVMDEHHSWFQRELKRIGANITTKPPEPVADAIAKIQRERKLAEVRYFEDVDPSIRDERARLVASIIEHCQALQAELPRIIKFDTEYKKFAATCGQWRPRPLTTRIEALSHALTELVECERRRSIEPPTPPAYEPPSTNPVEIGLAG